MMGIYSDMEFRHVNDVSVKTTDEIRQRNRELCLRFPFLIPRNAFSGKKITDCVGEHGEVGYWPGSPADHPEFDYEYTMLDCMPDGWRTAFGEEMCREIMDELEAHDFVDDYYVLQIKEKYGRLEWYDDGAPGKVQDIIDKYGELSTHICIGCGKPATLMSTGWISPWCDECAGSFKQSYIPIEEWFKPYEES